MCIVQWSIFSVRVIKDAALLMRFYDVVLTSSCEYSIFAIYTYVDIEKILCFHQLFAVDLCGCISCSNISGRFSVIAFVSARKKGSLIWLRRTNGRGHPLHIQMNANGNRMRARRENTSASGGRDAKREHQKIYRCSQRIIVKTNSPPCASIKTKSFTLFISFGLWVY